MIFYSAKTSKISTRFSPTPNISNEVHKSAAFQQEILKLKKKESLGQAFNGPSLMVNGVGFSEYAQDIVLELCEVDYFTSQALSAYNQSKSVNITNFRQCPTGSFGAATFVISNESKVLTALRANSCGSYPGVRAFCFGEGAHTEDLKDLRLISSRCLREELGFIVPANFVEICGLFFDESRKTWALISLVDLTDKGAQFNAQNLIDLARDAQDSWENEDLVAMPIIHCKFLSMRSKQNYPFNQLISLIKS